MKRILWMKQSRQENIVYLVVWGLLFAAPLLSLYVRTVSQPGAVPDWSEVFFVWRKYVPYLLLFLVHNFLLAPLLVQGHRRMTYFVFVALMLVGFAVFQCSNKPDKPLRHTRHEMMRPPMEAHGDERMPPEFRPHRRGDRGGPVAGEHDIIAIVVLILMLGANLGIKGYYRSRSDRRRLAELEKQNLEQQLEYLRYQINPHFFMNTLNNIHALVDIDPGKAQTTIVELSKMMRFVLYEGNKQGVSLSREFDFIRHYITLMKLRYTERVRITLDLPQETPDRTIPPLILITFIENAFKHGVSYQRESFIEVKAAVEGDKLQFTCRNSMTERANTAASAADSSAQKGEQQGGVGLVNVRKRLDLLYDHSYSLNISDDADIYIVELMIPL